MTDWIRFYCPSRGTVAGPGRKFIFIFVIISFHFRHFSCDFHPIFSEADKPARRRLRPGARGAAMPHEASAKPELAHFGGSGARPPPASPLGEMQERLRILTHYHAMARPSYRACANDVGRCKDTVKKIVKAAQSNTPTLQRLSTGGILNSLLKLGVHGLLYLRVRYGTSGNQHVSGTILPRLGTAHSSSRLGCRLSYARTQA